MSYLNPFPYLLGKKKELQPIPEHIKEHAKFIKHAFNKPEARARSTDYGEYIPGYSNDLMATYYKPEQKQYNIAIRGTDLSSFDRAVKDLKTDASIITGSLRADPQYKEARNTIRRIRKSQYDEGITPDINIYGFSLGGSVAKQLSNDVLGIKSVALNPGSVFSNQPDNPNSFTYRIKGDVISRLSDTSRSQSFEVPSLYSHGLNSFLE